MWKSRWIASVLAACSGDDPPDCGVGFEPGPGDNCYQIVDEPEDTGEDTAGQPIDETPLAEVISELPPCDAEPGNGELSLLTLCAGPLCVDMTYEELVAADTEVPTCEVDPDGYVSCDWLYWDLRAWFRDEDLDGIVLPDQLPTGIYVYADFPGATGGGLTVGESVACFVDVFGLPDSLQPIEYGGEVWIYAWAFDDFRFYVYDSNDAVGYGSDGLIDLLWLNGPG